MSTTITSVYEQRPDDLLGAADLHRRFVAALGTAACAAQEEAELRRKPMELACQHPLPWTLRVYLFNCTQHASERDPGGYRIQLHVPGQRRGQRGSFDHTPGAMVVVGGFVLEFEVFVLWDAHAHPSFPNSKGVQVASSTVHRAAIAGVAEQVREVRSAAYQEQVVAARADCLVDGLRRRQGLTRDSLLGAEQMPIIGAGEEPG